MKQFVKSSVVAAVGVVSLSVSCAKPDHRLTIVPIATAGDGIVGLPDLSEDEQHALKTTSGKLVLLEKANREGMKKNRVYWFRPYLCRQKEWENVLWREQFLADVRRQGDLPLFVADRGDDEFKYIVWVGLTSSNGLPPTSEDDR